MAAPNVNCRLHLTGVHQNPPASFQYQVGSKLDQYPVKKDRIHMDPNWISIWSKRTGSTWVQTGSVSGQKGADPHGSKLDQYPVKKDRIHMDPNWISIRSKRTGSIWIQTGSVPIRSKRTGSTWIQTGSVSGQKGPDPHGSKLNQYPVK